LGCCDTEKKGVLAPEKKERKKERRKKQKKRENKREGGKSCWFFAFHCYFGV